jgi:hypothetical protein
LLSSYSTGKVSSRSQQLLSLKLLEISKILSGIHQEKDGSTQIYMAKLEEIKLKDS